MYVHIASSRSHTARVETAVASKEGPRDHPVETAVASNEGPRDHPGV